MNDEQVEPKASWARLQRPPDFTGGRLTTFRSVVLRHGLPGALLGLLCLLFPPTRALLESALAAMLAQPLRYFAVGLLIFVGLNAYGRFVSGRWQLNQLVWVVYLGVLSLWEEWVFRVALPYHLADQGIDLRTAIIASSLLFGLAHYFTLRWRWQWCVGAFVGGLALSFRFVDHQDLMLITGLHWVVTFLNTPRPPGQTRS